MTILTGSVAKFSDNTIGVIMKTKLTIIDCVCTKLCDRTMSYIKLGRKIYITFLFVLFPILSNATTIDFEALSDGEIVSNQFSGIIFSNATALSSGISLNELEFPPHSGTNVVFDDGGYLTLGFTSPISSFSGYFTYAEPLSIQGFDSLNILRVSTNSQFTNNLLLSGVIGSSPNELLSLNYSGNISKIIIAGNPGGGSFVMDDMAFIYSTTVPEPSSVLLLLFSIFPLVFKFARENMRISSKLS